MITDPTSKITTYPHWSTEEPNGEPAPFGSVQRISAREQGHPTDG